MENLFILALLGYSIYWLLNYKLNVNQYLAYTELIDMKFTLKSRCKILSELLACVVCLSFWTGFFALLYLGYGLMLSFVLGLVVAILAYFISLLEKWLVRNSI